jgi:hypothetical protein
MRIKPSKPRVVFANIAKSGPAKFAYPKTRNAR